MNLNVAGGEVSGGGVTVTQADREEVIIAGSAVVSHVHGKAESRSSPAHSLRSGEMGVVAVDGQTRNAALVDRNVRGWIVVAKITSYRSSLT